MRLVVITLAVALGLSVSAAGQLGASGALSATGADTRVTSDRPDDIAGPQVHLVYALPSDGVDRHLDTDGTLANEWAVWQQWFAGQTNGRVFRTDTIDRAVDITFFRLTKTDAAVEAMGAYVRDEIEAELRAAGLLAPGKIYAVWYDGSSTWACGGGAWPPTLPGVVGALYLHGRPLGAPACDTNPFAAPGGQAGYLEFAIGHELIHTLGFVATCAPHFTLAGHVSDSPTDLMWAGPQPWHPSVLDIGHDDYWEHSNPSCPDLADSPFIGALVDTVVDAVLDSVTVDRKNGKRRVTATLTLQEKTTVSARLLRGGQLLASATPSIVSPGSVTLTLVVKKTTAKGAARLEVTLVDLAGNKQLITKTVLVPAPR